MKAVEKIGYRPDPMLSALSARRNQSLNRRVLANIAAIIDDRWLDTARDWVDAVLQSMRSTSRELGYDLDVLYVKRDLLANANPDRLLHGRGIRGIAIFPFVEHDYWFELDWSQYSIIALGIRPLKYAFNRVGSDAFTGMALTCDHLYELGYRRIGLAHELASEKRTRYEWLGALSKECFLKPPRLKVVPPCLPEFFDEPSYVAWIKKEKPECVITNDIRCVDFLRNAGYRVPEDIGVTLLTPAYTAAYQTAGVIHQHSHIGSTTIEQLHGMMMRGEAGIPEVSKEMLIYPQWAMGPTVRRVR